MSRIGVRKSRPLTEWGQRSAEERATILNAPFPVVQRIAGKPWAGTIVVDETDDPVLRHYKAVASKSEGSDAGTVDNVYRSMEG